MEIGLARIKKDGAITIPFGMRTFFKQGETVFLLADEKRITIKRASDVNGALRQLAQEPSSVGGVKPAAKAPLKMPKRDKFGHFLPAKKAVHSRK